MSDRAWAHTTGAGFWPGGGDLYSRNYGSVQRLPNGNTFFPDSEGECAIEITEDGDIVWEWNSRETREDDVMPIYRTFKHDAALVAGVF